MTQLRNRIIHLPQVRKANEEERVVEFVASDASVDSYGTVLNPNGWDLKRYNRNGIVGYQHEVYGGDDPDNVIGRGEAFVEDNQLILRVTFEPADLNPKADKIYRKVLFGTLNGVSVGFKSLKGHWGESKRGEDPNVYYYDSMELLEVSVVNIPSNANAVKRSFDEERQALEAERPAPQSEETNATEVEALADHICLTVARAKAQLAKNIKK